MNADVNMMISVFMSATFALVLHLKTVSGFFAVSGLDGGAKLIEEICLPNN